MCEDIYARFRCAQKHEEEGGDGTKKKHILQCALAQQIQVSCPEPRDQVHDTSEDDPEEDCPECKGDTPPETP